jgi:hypothetical protein
VGRCSCYCGAARGYRPYWLNWFTRTRDSYTVTQSSGTVISFTEEKVYGTIASPETGNITNSLTGALLGRCVLIIHNSSYAPTFPASWKKTGGNYVTSTNNFIYAMYIDNNNIHYHIKQVI